MGCALIGWLMLGAALAQEPVEPEEPAPEPQVEDLQEGLQQGLEEARGDPGELIRFIEDGEVVHELTVYGDLRVEMAREQVLDTLAEAGYTDMKDMGDYIRVRHPQVWKGEIRVYDDGWIKMKRQPVQFRSPKTFLGEEGSVASGLTCILLIPCLRMGGQTVSKKRYTAQEVRTFDAVHEDVEALADRVADRETGERINDLPEQLDQVWYEGVSPWDGSEVETPAERKQALLDYWDSRTDTVWGDRVRVAVEAYLRSEVQGTDDEFTRAEVEAFNERRHCTRVLDLWSPWEQVTADVEGSL